MENTPNNNLISDACDKITSGYDFGGWTDPLDESLGANDVNQIRLRNKIPMMKYKEKQKLQKIIDRFKLKLSRKKSAAEAKDIRRNPNDNIRLR